MQKVYFKTFGCRTNIYDTQIMTSKFGAHQITLNENDANVIIINSCTVTNGADSSVRQFVNKIRATKTNVRLLFTGCGVDTLGAALLKDGKIDGLFGSSEKLKAPEFANSNDQVVKIGVKDFIDDAIIWQTQGKSRAYIKIQEGCDFACSYCIIPRARGNSRSLHQTTILTQIKLLADNGLSDFTLTGTNVGSYQNLAKLIAKIYDISGVKRLRLGSIEPCQVNEELLDVMSHNCFARHIHVALQHVDTQILKSMNRHNNFADDQKLLYKLHSLGFAIGTDFIVGFPNETKDIWDNSLAKVKDLPLTHIHPFIFSPRDNTPAASLKGASRGDESKARLKAINDLIVHKNFIFRQSGQKLLVFVEENGSGYDQFYNRCEIPNVSPKSWVEVSQYDVLQNTNQATQYQLCKK